MRSLHQDRGFTLVELVIVVLILGILAAVAAPRVLTNSRDAEATALMRQIEVVINAAEMIRATTDTWPSTFQKNGIPGDFVGILAARAFENVAGESSESGVDAWIQWSYLDTPTVEFAAVFVYGVNVEVATQLDEMFDDGHWTQGSIRITTGTNANVATVQFDVVFVLK